MLSIQTNVNSLVAQQNLNTNSIFQSKTIQQLTSGYRINSSGDDAAGLAVANKFRSSVAELTQGVANGNDGVASLQIMDGGMNNIALMLDRLKTLAMQSASDSFTGGVTGRAQLNSEFQTDIAEIDRQAQSIGLNTGGTFAKNLAVYLGAGSGSQSQANSVVNVDLSKATVDSQSLGLTGFAALYTTASGSTYDLGSSSVSSVANIVAANGLTSTQFTFNGPGFSDSANGSNAQAVQITVNLSGVGDLASLVNNINTAIQSQQGVAGGNYAGFKAANIVASVHTDSTGAQQLQFLSSSTAFQVSANDKASAALLGDFSAASTAMGTAGGVSSSGTSLISKGAYELATPATSTTAAAEADLSFTCLVGKQVITISAVDGNGGNHQLSIKLDSAGGAGAYTASTVGTALAAINDALQATNDTTLKQIVAINKAGTGQTAAGEVGSFNFISNVANFSIAVTPTSTSGGITVPVFASQGQDGVAAAIQVGTGGAADISTVAGAQQAVTAITAAVGALGTAQAAVGKGQNALNYGISLAQSEITNFAAAESYIRDANVAQQAANLTKAQVLQQASIAAMAQANSAPQAVLTLLRG